jgi:uncharacterized membrane protein YidH (DUF202 family)
MHHDLVFKTGPAKRTLGWLVFLAAAGAFLAMIYGIFAHRKTQTSADLWSGVAIGVFLIGLMVAGIAIQHARWSIDGENIIRHHLFKQKTIPISELAGFGRIIVVVVVIPLVHVDLYDRELNLVARLPVNHKDWPKAEAWFAEHLRYVVNDGSAALPKRRFADTPKI